MQFLESYYKYSTEGVDKEVIKSILSQFKDSILTKVSAVQTDKGEVFLCIDGTKDGSYYTCYYYDSLGNEHKESIWYKKLGHVSYDSQTNLYQEYFGAKSIRGQDQDSLYKSFEIYESRFAKKQTMVGFDPEYKRHTNIYQLCDGQIKFIQQYELCGRTFLEFKVDNKRNFPGPIMVESSGKRLTHWEGTGFQVFPSLGVIAQSKSPDLDGTAMVEYNIFDVTMGHNPCLLSDKINLKIDAKTGAISCGNEKGYAMGNPYFGPIDTPKEQLSVSGLREQYLQRQKERQCAQKRKEESENILKETSKQLEQIAEISNKIGFFQKIKKSFSRS